MILHPLLHTPPLASPAYIYMYIYTYMLTHVYADTSRIHILRRLAALYIHVYTTHYIIYLYYTYSILYHIYTAHVYSIYSYMYMTGALHPLVI